MSRSKSRNLNVISTDNYVIISEGHEMISFQSYDKESDKTIVEPLTTGNKKINLAKWGKDNLLPQRREGLIQDNNIAGQLIQTIRDITIGGGLMFYKSRYENGKKIREQYQPDNSVLDWLEQTNIDDVIECAVGELGKHAQVHYELIAKSKKEPYQIAQIDVKRNVNMRCQKQDQKGVVNGYYYSGNWSSKIAGQKAISQKIETTFIPSFDPKKWQPKSILHVGDKLFFDGYYYKPFWWGSRSWITTANQVPEFHTNNLKNGYMIRYHIEFPADYFLDNKAYLSADDKAQKELMTKAKAAEQQFVDDINKFFAGTQNSGRAVFTKFFYELDKKYPGITITPLEVDLKDEALLKLYDKSNDAVVSGFGLPPVLSSIQTQGKLSSGSDYRNALNYYISTKLTVPRKNILKPLYIVKKLNGWDKDLEFGFHDTLIAKLDDEKTGISSTQS